MATPRSEEPEGEERHPPRSRTRTVAGLAAVNLAAFLALLLAAEVFLRSTGRRTYARTFPGESHPLAFETHQIEPDRMLGWVSNRSRPDVNRQGFRDPRDFSQIDPSSGKRRVMVLGDSFIWGVGIESHQTVPRRLEERLGDGVEVYSVAAPGWGIDQMYLAYREYALRIAPHVVILAYIDDDIRRTLEAYYAWAGQTKPCLEVRDGRLMPRTRASAWEAGLTRWTRRSVFLSQVLQQVFMTFDAGPVARRILEDLAAAATERGARFVIVRIPASERFYARAPWFFRIPGFEGLPEDSRPLYLDLGDALRRTPGRREVFYLEDYGHLSPAGTDLLAGELARALGKTPGSTYTEHRPPPARHSASYARAR